MSACGEPNSAPKCVSSRVGANPSVTPLLFALFVLPAAGNGEPNR